MLNKNLMRFSQASEFESVFYETTPNLLLKLSWKRILPV